MSKTTQIVIIVVLAAVLVALCGTAAYLLLRPPDAPAPQSTAIVDADADGSWDRIRTAGKIVVGTSADYPPFEYLTGDSLIDGFDIALMDEVGRRLGVQVEYRNMAFEGLTSALQLGQIDAAIAAMAVTPERQAVVDFTNIYFVGEDSILAGQDSDITSITSPDELSSAKIGVQRGTVHQDWVEDTLVSAGLLPADNLFVYLNAQDAVRDLQQGRLDLVILDSQPAQTFAAEGGVKVVGQGLDQQLLALSNHVFDAGARPFFHPLGIEITGGNLLERQNTVPVGAVIHKGRLQAWFDPGDLARVDIGLFLFQGGGFNVKIIQSLPVHECNPQLLRLSRVDQQSLHVFLLRCSTVPSAGSMTPTAEQAAMRGSLVAGRD
mgnify:CR=1 FL=1